MFLQQLNFPNPTLPHLFTIKSFCFGVYAVASASSHPLLSGKWGPHNRQQQQARRNYRRNPFLVRPVLLGCRRCLLGWCVVCLFTLFILPSHVFILQSFYSSRFPYDSIKRASVLLVPPHLPSFTVCIHPHPCSILQLLHLPTYYVFYFPFLGRSSPCPGSFPYFIPNCCGYTYSPTEGLKS